MSFFKRLVPLKAEMVLQLEKLDVEDGEPFKGTASLVSNDKFGVENVRLEIRVKESWREPRTTTDSRGHTSTTMTTVTQTLYSRDVPIFESFEMGVGDKKTFPFEVGLSMFQPTRYGGQVSYSIKAVANVKGRPDVTKEVQPWVKPSSGVTKIIQKEIIKIPCKFCGALVELTSDVNKCPSCGAPIKIS
jgi:hypothetical protein